MNTQMTKRRRREGMLAGMAYIHKQVTPMAGSMRKQTAVTNRLGGYHKPDLMVLGRVADHTGHCTTGCDHDSRDHPDEYKRATELQ